MTAVIVQRDRGDSVRIWASWTGRQRWVWSSCLDWETRRMKQGSGGSAETIQPFPYHSKKNTFVIHWSQVDFYNVKVTFYKMSFIQWKFNNKTILLILIHSSQWLTQGTYFSALFGAGTTVRIGDSRVLLHYTLILRILHQTITTRQHMS